MLDTLRKVDSQQDRVPSKPAVPVIQLQLLQLIQHGL